MILIVGGMASGKRGYAMARLGYGPEQMADGVLDERPVLYNLQDLVARDPSATADLFDALAGKEVVICNEVGSGVIPADPRQRAEREATGRLCNRLAVSAEEVVRMVCGIPTVIKP